MGDSPKWVKSKKRRKKEKKKRERLNKGDNNGQAMHGARKPPGPMSIFLLKIVHPHKKKYAISFCDKSAGFPNENSYEVPSISCRLNPQIRGEKNSLPNTVCGRSSFSPSYSHEVFRGGAFHYLPVPVCLSQIYEQHLYYLRFFCTHLCIFFEGPTSKFDLCCIRGVHTKPKFDI